MSTRCQVKVIQQGLSWEQSVTLYHHTDGYPSNMLPMIAGARSKEQWKNGRAGKVASFLCAADPGVFEPEAGHDLHPDIEYFYVLRLINRSEGSMVENPAWRIGVYVPNDEFWEAPTFTNLTNLGEWDADEGAAKAKQIELEYSDRA